MVTFGVTGAVASTRGTFHSRLAIGLSAKVSEALSDSIRVREMGLRALAHEHENGCGESCPERLGLSCADVSILESSERVSGKIVVAARLHSGQPLAEAGKRERMVAHSADVMLGPPDTSALDARTCVKRVDHAPPEEVPRDRRRGNEEPPGD